VSYAHLNSQDTSDNAYFQDAVCLNTLLIASGQPRLILLLFIAHSEYFSLL